MRYWGFVARGLQSKVLHLAINKLSKWLLFAFKHPLKTCWYIFRLYLILLLAGLCLTFVTSKAIAQSIYDSAYSAGQSVDASITESCDRTPTLQEALASLPEGYTSPDGTSRYSNYKYVWTYTYPNTECKIQYGFERTRQLKGADGTWYNPPNNIDTQKIDANGPLIQAPQCPPLSNDANGESLNQDHIHMSTVSNGTTQCFSSQTLEDFDSCDSSTPDLLGTADSPALTCYTKSDGSKCAMSKYEVNGQFAYTQNYEPSSCYEGEIAVNPYEDPTTDDLTGAECQELGNGIRACPSDPSEVCNASTGQCNEGCGTYDIGNGPVFMCLQDSDATCDPTTTASCGSTTTPTDPTDPEEPYEPPVTPEDPEFQTATGTNTLLSGTNEILSGVEQGVQGVSTGVQGVKSELEHIKDELKTNKTVVFDNDIYTANDYNERNYGTVLEDAVTQMRNTELVQSVNTFFDVDLNGTCPVYSTTVPYINTTITIDQFCGSVMTSIWPIVSAIIILVFSVLAFRVAVL